MRQFSKNRHLEKGDSLKRARSAARPSIAQTVTSQPSRPTRLRRAV